MTDSDHDRESVAVLKRDRRGRVLTTPSQRLALLQEFEKSGLSGPAFAQVGGIKYQTFATWRQQQKNPPCSTIRGKRHATLKREMFQGGCFADTIDAKLELFEYIEGYYNHPESTPPSVTSPPVSSKLNPKPKPNSLKHHRGPIISCTSVCMS